jgi:hypothetical protein
MATQTTGASVDLRANDSKNEGAPRQVAVLVAGDDGLKLGCPTRTALPPIRSREVGHGDESSDEEKVHDYKEPAKDGWRTGFHHAGEQGYDDGVQNGRGKDPLDSTVRHGCLLGQTDDLDQAGSEETQGDDCRDELERAEDALERVVRRRGAEFVHECHLEECSNY